MTKRQLIDQILSLNTTAEPEFLAQFPDQDLDKYLDHLNRARLPRMPAEPAMASITPTAVADHEFQPVQWQP